MMKKIYSKLLLGSSLVLLLAGGAQAVPIFDGDTYADWGVDNFVPADEVQGPGYYMWSNDSERTSWSVRWTGGDWTQGFSEYVNDVFPDAYKADVYYWLSWNGSVSYSGGAITSVTPISWETPHDSVAGLPAINSDGDIVFSGSINGFHWDGFDFTITPATDATIGFHLDGSIYSPVEEGGLGYVAPQGLYIGQNLSLLTDSYIGGIEGMYGSINGELPTGTAPVPEPGTMILFGTGLAGLAGVYRKKRMQ